MSAIKVALRECLNRTEIAGMPGSPKTLAEDTVTERYAHLERGRLERAAQLLVNVPPVQPPGGTQSFHESVQSPALGTANETKSLFLQ